MRIYAGEIEIFDPKTLMIIRRHLKNPKRGSFNMAESERIFNPSRKTQSYLDQAAKIGPKTRELCEDLFKGEGRPGQRRMRGVLSLARKHSATVIEAACALAVSRRVRSSKIVREIIERLEAEKNPPPPSAPLAQSHELIRSIQDYALFFEHHAHQETTAAVH